jgi:site-specific DNA recombinase
MSKRAAIYVRVSSEMQAERVSPEAQEKDSRDYCQNKGYQVIEVYRDIAKYRIGRKLVEPSGTRADRPELRRMLADARSGRFDVIIGWREDRLYRSYRPMLDVLDCLDETGIDIELVKEMFDKKIAPVKAWAARMELDAKHDRFMMGVNNRFERQKDWNSRPLYGYDKVDGRYQVNEAEALVVNQIFQWFGNGATRNQIRTWLISENAQQRDVPKKYPWSLGVVYAILRKDCYHTGKLIRKWNNQVHELEIPPIIDLETARHVKVRLARFKNYPAGKLKAHALAAGLIFCAGDGNRLSVKQNRTCTFYACNNIQAVAMQLEGCAGYRTVRKVDNLIWAKVAELIGKPGLLDAAIDGKIRQLQLEEIDVTEECEKLERQLAEIVLERQKVITWARKDFITEGDLQMQLNELDNREDEFRREMNEKRLLVGGHAKRMKELADLFIENAQIGWEALNNPPQTPEEAEVIFEGQRDLVQKIVKRVDLFPDKSVKVYFDIELPEEVVTSIPVTSKC